MREAERTVCRTLINATVRHLQKHFGRCLTTIQLLRLENKMRHFVAGALHLAVRRLCIIRCRLPPSSAAASSSSAAPVPHHPPPTPIIHYPHPIPLPIDRRRVRTCTQVCVRCMRARHVYRTATAAEVLELHTLVLTKPHTNEKHHRDCPPPADDSITVCIDMCTDMCVVCKHMCRCACRHVCRHVCSLLHTCV